MIPLALAITFIILDLSSVLGLQNIITTFAIIIALETAVFTLINNKKALRQSEINLNKQLLHEDKKNAIIELWKIMDFPPNFMEDELNNFLKSPQSIYLPNEVELRLYALFDYHFNPKNAKKEIRKICKEILLNP